MLVKEFLFHSTYVFSEEWELFLKMRVSEICVKRIRVNQGLGVSEIKIFLLNINFSLRVTFPNWPGCPRKNGAFLFVRWMVSAFQLEMSMTNSQFNPLANP